MTKTANYEIRDDRFRRSVKLDEPIEQIWTGGKWTEGPVYSPALKSTHSALFSIPIASYYSIKRLVLFNFSCAI